MQTVMGAMIYRHVRARHKDVTVMGVSTSRTPRVTSAIRTNEATARFGNHIRADDIATCCSTEEASGFAGESSNIGSQRDSHLFYGSTLQRTEAIGQYDQTEWKRCDRKAVLNNDQGSGQENGSASQKMPTTKTQLRMSPRTAPKKCRRIGIQRGNTSLQ